MASDNQHIEIPTESWKGLDLRRSNLLRDPHSFVRGDNVFITKNEGITRRPGQKVLLNLAQNIGLAEYVNIPATGGATTVKKLACGSKLYSIETGVVTITYVGVGLSVLFNHYCLDTQFVFSIEVDGVIVYTKNLGAGIDDTVPVTIATLVSEIDALADFVCTATGTTSGPAAYLPMVLGDVYGSSPYLINYEYPLVVPQPSTAADPFANAWAARNAVNFNTVTYASANNVTYLGSRYDNEVKYDGKVYRSGVPQFAAPTALAVATATGRTGTNIQYRISAIQIDKSGNRIEGIISDPSGTVSPAADRVDVTYTSITAASGFNTDCAMVVGIQAAVTTVNVDNGAGGAHTLKVGDTAYFFDTAAATHVTRVLTGVTANTITFAGVVSVADNDPISANLRVGMYTQLIANGDYFLVAEFPNNSWIATPIISDTGQTLAIKYLFPLPGTEPGLPPMAQYRAIYKSLKFLSGLASAIDQMSFSDITSLEAYPPTANRFTIKTNQQAKYTGLLATRDYLFVGKENSSHSLVGDLDETGFFRYRYEDQSATIGPSCQNMKQIGDGSILFICRRGVFRSTGQGEPEEISEPISPIFTKKANIDAINWNRITAGYDNSNWRYFFFLPIDASDGANLYSDYTSIAYHLDLSTISNQGSLRFFPILDLDFGGGFLESNNLLYFSSRRRSTVTGLLATELSKFSDTGTQYDQIDQLISMPYISWDVAPGWNDTGDPSQFVMMERLRVFSQDPDIASEFILEASTNINYVDSGICSNIFNFGQVGGSGYDQVGYDTEGYDPGSEPDLKQKLKRIKAKSFQVEFSNTEKNKIPIISGWEWEVSTPYKKVMQE